MCTLKITHELLWAGDPVVCGVLRKKIDIVDILDYSKLIL